MPEAEGTKRQLSIGEAIAKAQGQGEVKSAKIVSDAFTDNSVEPLDDVKNLAYRSNLKRVEAVMFTRLMGLADYADMEKKMYAIDDDVLGDLLRLVGVWHYKHEAAVDGKRVEMVLDAAAKLHVEEFEIRKHDNAATKIIGA